MSTRNLSLIGLLVAAALFLAVNILGSAALRSARLDLTENKLYTLTSGSRNIARAVEEPIHLKLFYSKKAAGGLPAVGAYAARVRQVLEEYERLGSGRIKVSVVDPEPFTEQEDEAVAAGLVGVPAPGGARLFFGLVATNSTDDQKVLPFFDYQKEQFLEYDVTKLVYTLMNPKRPVVGLISSLPIEGVEPERFDPRQQQPRQPAWQIVTQMKEFFTVRVIPAQDVTLPDDLDVLMVVHPKNLSDAALYAIDQYVLKGGRLVAFVDPNCEADTAGAVDLQSMIRADKSSQLTKLFDAWGVSMARDRIAADQKAAEKVATGGNPNQPETAPFVPYIKVTGDMFARDDAVAGQFAMMYFATSGILDKKSGDQGVPELVFTPIIRTTDDSMRMEQARVQFMPQPKELLADFVSGGERLTLAARVSGKLKSAFASGPPAPADGAPAPERPAHVAQAEQPVNVVLCADVDMLSDRFWVREDRLMGQILLGYVKFADNGDFVLSLIEQLTGSQDLISVRARGQYARPFTRVQAIQKEADQKHLKAQQDLDKKIRETETRIREIQQRNPDAGAQAGRMILTPEQQKEIEKLQNDLLATRKEKRQVELQMRRDIEGLRSTLYAINAAAIPAAVCLGALGLATVRASRRRADRARASRSAG